MGFTEKVPFERRFEVEEWARKLFARELWEQQIQGHKDIPVRHILRLRAGQVGWTWENVGGCSWCCQRHNKRADHVGLLWIIIRSWAFTLSKMGTPAGFWIGGEYYVSDVFLSDYFCFCVETRPNGEKVSSPKTRIEGYWVDTVFISVVSWISIFKCLMNIFPWI